MRQIGITMVGFGSGWVMSQSAIHGQWTAFVGGVLSAVGLMVLLAGVHRDTGAMLDRIERAARKVV